MTIALTGASGLLGQAFSECSGDSGELHTLPRQLLDPDHPEALAAKLSHLQPRWLLNCAAHTDVEGAEDNPTVDARANSVLPGVLAEVCRSLNIGLVHFSSTGCYGIAKSQPYTEEDPLCPTTTHHRHKAAGEQAIRHSGARHLIIRTGWLFGGQAGQAKNFVWKRLLEADRSSAMASDAIQMGCPTFVGDLARQVLDLLEQPIEGTFNAVAQGHASRYEYVRAIVEASGLPCTVNPGPAFARRAKVSSNECATNAKLQSLGLDHMPQWQGALTHYVKELMATSAWQERNQAAVSATRQS